MAQPYQNYLEAYNRYMDMVRQGISPVQAIQDSGLMGIREQEQKNLGAKQQSAAIGQLGGQLTGALGTQAVKDAVAGEKILGGLRDGIGNIFGGSSSVAQTAAENAAWNAGADAASGLASSATPPVQGSMFAPGGTLSTALGGLGIGLGAYGAFKGIEKGDPVSAGLGGAGLAAGLSQVGLALGPAGWALAIGAPLAGSFLNKDVNSKERNVRKTKALLEMGFTPEQLGTRIDAQGKPVVESGRFTKEAAETWNKLTSSEDPNVNPLRQPTGIWGTEGMLETFGPDYFNKMNEFDRYVAGTAAVENNQIYEKKGELLVKDKEGLRTSVEQLKADPEKLAQLQANYNAWKNTGKDIGIPKIQTQQQKEAENKAKSIYTTWNN